MAKAGEQVAASGTIPALVRRPGGDPPFVSGHQF